MSIKEPNRQATSNTQNEVARTIVDFMTDCGLRDADMNAGHMHLAFQFAYGPLPRFWRDFDMAALIGVIVFFVQNLAVCFEITREINHLNAVRFRENASF
ncbi:hypothetical protein [uncultured Paraburkholderia sp.]|uniref:hypothetical protein n=1 Tax=uncultured Paraburkholderia sp. TaxID=1822466 RepID=UPI0025919254|nr:hypothetical protein [uncultured Paraburkholderia sp.]